MRLKAHEVSKYYPSAQGQVRVLQGVSLTLEPGEIVAVVGPNGSGKTTLVGLLSGVIQPTTGSVAHLAQEEDAQREGIAVLWQNYRESNFPWLNVLDNVALSGVFARRSRLQTRARASSVLADLLPEVDPLAPVYRLSGGQQQVVALARALATEPRAVLADEALSATDQARNWLLVSHFETWWVSRRVPVLWVSHNLDEAILLADRIAMLSVKEGRIAGTMSVAADRPRTAQMLASKDAVGLRRTLVEFLKEEEEWRLQQRTEGQAGRTSA